MPTRTETHVTRSPAETRRLAADLLPRLAPGAVLALHGELGAGKTCFVQGLAAAAGVAQPVNSPTFTLIHEYRGARPIYHVDLYRLRDADDAFSLGLEEYFNGRGLVVIEWAERAAEILPPGAWHITFQVGQSPEERTIEIEKPQAS